MRRRQTFHTPPTAPTPTSSDVGWSMESICPQLQMARESLVPHFSPIHVQPRNLEINVGIERHQQSPLGKFCFYIIVRHCFGVYGSYV